MSNKIDKISPLGKKILKALKDQRLRKKDIYDKMGISRGTLDNWISGATAPDHNQVELMFKILGIVSAVVPSFRDEIFEGDYIGMHKRVWSQHEENMKTHRELLKTFSETIKSLVGTGKG